MQIYLKYIKPQKGGYPIYENRNNKKGGSGICRGMRIA